MGALALNQLLESAQDRQVDLVLETAKVENARLLEEVERMSLDAIPKHQRRGVGELTSIKDEAKVCPSSLLNILVLKCKGSAGEHWEAGGAEQAVAGQVRQRAAGGLSADEREKRHSVRGGRTEAASGGGRGKSRPGRVQERE